MAPRNWSGGFIPSREAVYTGTIRRQISLPRVLPHNGNYDNNSNKSDIESDAFVTQQGASTRDYNNYSSSTSSSAPRRCIFNYEDKYQFRRIICGTDLLFDSHFEGGNLIMAHRYEKPSISRIIEYDLSIHHDVHSVGHKQWFYFSVSNTVAGMIVKFNIGDFTKRKSLYNSGMRPLVFSAKSDKGWTRCGQNIRYSRRTRNKNSNAYTLTFTHQFEYSGDTCYFASSYPYTYSDLQDYLMELQNQPSRARVFRRELLCRTLANNRCDVITITEPTSSLSAIKKRLGVVITARVHPGESNASWMCKGILDFLTGDTQEAKSLREGIVFKIIPMLNPDGVVNGNYRTSLSGADLNRRWDNPHYIYHPTVYKTKNLVRRFQKCRPIITVCDLHGHSRKEGLFMYGCEPSITMRKAKAIPNIKCTTLPKIFHDKSVYFSFPSCNFKMQNCRCSTMRVVMNQEFRILCSYTLEASLSGYNGMHFSTNDLMNIGRDYCLSLLLFYNEVKPNIHEDDKENSDIELTFDETIPLPGCNNKSKKKSFISSGNSTGSDSDPSVGNIGETEAIMLVSNEQITKPSSINIHIRKREKKKKKEMNNSSFSCKVNLNRPLKHSSPTTHNNNIDHAVNVVKRHSMKKTLKPTILLGKKIPSQNENKLQDKQSIPIFNFPTIIHKT